MNINTYYRKDKNRRSIEYAIVVYLPKELDDIVIPFREKYDPDYNLIASHITVVFPFETKHPLDELSDVIKEEVKRIKPFEIELESIGDFYPNAPIIYWVVKDNKTINELYYNLYSKLNLPIPFKKYIPHVTIAKEISDHRVETVKDAIVSYLPNEKFFATSIDLITPLVSDRWASVRTFNIK